MKRINFRSDRGEAAAALPFLILIIGLLAVLVINSDDDQVVAEQGTDERAVAERSEKAIDYIDRTFGVTILGHPVVGTNESDLTEIKINRGGEILDCDAAAVESDFIVTCDSPEGRITLEEK